MKPVITEPAPSERAIRADERARIAAHVLAVANTKSPIVAAMLRDLAIEIANLEEQHP